MRTGGGGGEGAGGAVTHYDLPHAMISRCLSSCVILLLRSYRRWDADRPVKAEGGGGRPHAFMHYDLPRAMISSCIIIFLRRGGGRQIGRGGRGR